MPLGQRKGAAGPGFPHPLQLFKASEHLLHCSVLLERQMKLALRSAQAHGEEGGTSCPHCKEACLCSAPPYLLGSLLVHPTSPLCGSVSAVTPASSPPTSFQPSALASRRADPCQTDVQSMGDLVFLLPGPHRPYPYKHMDSRSRAENNLDLVHEKDKEQL